jgi:predicted RNA binding protein YcfA (HicA-like mRNA interferase family)
VLERITGSHHIFGKAGLDVKLSVPVHANRPLNVGTWKALKTLAGI